jgi:hypothetical protein
MPVPYDFGNSVCCPEGADCDARQRAFCFDRDACSWGQVREGTSTPYVARLLLGMFSILPGSTFCRSWWNGHSELNSCPVKAVKRRSRATQ